MKKIFTFFLIICIAISCKKDIEQTVKEPSEKAKFCIVIHGGAGTILKENIPSEKEAVYRNTLEEAIRIGHNILKNGGSSLDAVEKTINILENSPLFNAGRGAVFTHDGFNEHDASIMDGRTLNAGASTCTKTVKNPISLARKVMEQSPHVMLSGKGAEQFAEEEGLEIVDSNYFFTKKSFDALQRIKNAQKTAFYNAQINDSKFGTVGCVALDKNGNLAAGTSTGGMTNKRWGRIGDSPIIGAGTYANNKTCAVSSTGWGEYFIRGMVAYDISALMEYKNWSLEKAAKEVIQRKLPSIGDGRGDGGIIAIDKNGNMVMEFNTAGMFRATMNDSDQLYIGMFKK